MVGASGLSQRGQDAAAVQATLTFCANALVFFFAGASSVNFLIRCSQSAAWPALSITSSYRQSA